MKEPVFRERACSVCIDNQRILAVKLRDPLNGREFWVPPGGRIESGESPAQAAVRETLEETGYLIQPDDARNSIRTYPFHWAGRDYLTKTHFVLAKLSDRVQRDTRAGRESYIVDLNWMAPKEALIAFELASPEVSAGVRQVIDQYPCQA